MHPRSKVSKKSDSKIISWLPYLSTCSDCKKAKPVFFTPMYLRKSTANPIKGLVKKRTTKLKTATVTAKGSKIARPAKKYFFMISGVFSLDVLLLSSDIFIKRALPTSEKALNVLRVFQVWASWFIGVFYLSFSIFWEILSIL